MKEAVGIEVKHNKPTLLSPISCALPQLDVYMIQTAPHPYQIATTVELQMSILPLQALRDPVRQYMQYVAKWLANMECWIKVHNRKKMSKC